MLDVFAEVIAPVLVVALVGGWVCRRIGVGAPAVSALSFFLFSPALVYHSMSTIRLGGADTVAIVTVTAAGAAATCGLAYVVMLLFRQDARTRAAVALTAGMANSGNLGLPVAALAFGDAGLDVAVIGFVTGAFVVNTLGVVVASSATGTVRGSLNSVVAVPSLWAAVLGFAVNASDVELPAVVTESADTLGGAAVPVMLVVLGLQLGRDQSTGGLPQVALSGVIRLVGGPVAAWALATALGMDGVTRDTLVVLGGMPTAVYTTILATQFSIRPPLVTRTVVLSTLASVVSLTILIAQYR